MSVDVAVSIVNHDNRDLLWPCLESLPAACEGLSWRATVTLNVPDAVAAERLAADFPDVEVVTNPAPLGFGANHNRVALAPAARHVLVLNDDTELAPGSVATLVKHLDDAPGAAAVVPTVQTRKGVAAPTRLAYPTAATALRMDLGRPFERVDRDGWLQGACVLLRSSAVAEVGGYDTRFFLFYEDCDLSLRLQRAGWDLAVCPDAVVTHAGHATVLQPGLAASTHLHGRRSRYLWFAKHRGTAEALAVSMLGRVLLAARGLTALVRRDRPQARHLLGLARYNPWRAP